MAAQRAKREILEYIHRDNQAGIPTYCTHLANHVRFHRQFWYERDLKRYMEKLEKAGLVVSHNHGNFYNLTEAGRTAIGVAC